MNITTATVVRQSTHSILYGSRRAPTVKILSSGGPLPTLSAWVPGRWVVAHEKTLWMTSCGRIIFARSLASVIIPIYCMHSSHWLSTGATYLKQFENAIVMCDKHCQAFLQFDTTFPQAVTAQWHNMVVAWDSDPTMPNPYVEPALGESTLWILLSRLANNYNFMTQAQQQVISS